MLVIYCGILVADHAEDSIHVLSSSYTGNYRRWVFYCILVTILMLHDMLSCFGNHSGWVVYCGILITILMLMISCTFSMLSLQSQGVSCVFHHLGGSWFYILSLLYSGNQHVSCALWYLDDHSLYWWFHDHAFEIIVCELLSTVVF